MKPIARVLSSLIPTTIIVSMLLSCSLFSGASTSGASTPGGTTAVSTFQVTSGSGKVTPHLDDKDLVDALIPVNGGQIHLTLPSGLSYTLDIPDGALMNDQEITLVPITRIDGMLLSGGLIGGVQLEPEGLELLKPATLTITVPKGYDPKQMVGFGYHGEGDGFHLDLATGDGMTITLPIFSFSGHGAASGTTSDITNQAAQPTGSAADAAAQQFANAAKQCMGQDPSQCLPWVQALIDMYNNQVQPDLTKAQNDDSKIDSAEAEFIHWLHMAQLSGQYGVTTINGEEYDLGTLEYRGIHLVYKGLRNAFDQESARCISQEDISQASKMMTRLHDLEILEDDNQPPYNKDTKWKDLEACRRYRLTFDSNLTWKLGDSMTVRADIKGSAIFRLDGPGEIVFYSTRNGPGTLTYDTFTAEFSGASAELNKFCKITTTSSSGKLAGSFKIWALTGATGNQVADPTVLLKPSAMTQNLPKWNCQIGGGGTINLNEQRVLPELPLWQAGFYDLHKDLLLGDYNENGYLVTNPYWFYQHFTPGDSVYHIGTLQLHSTGTSSGSTVEEDLTIDIVGAPGATQ